MTSNQKRKDCFAICKKKRETLGTSQVKALFTQKVNEKTEKRLLEYITRNITSPVPQKQRSIVPQANVWPEPAR